MWGAEVREFEGDIQFKNPGEDWKFATAKNPKHKLGIDPIEEKYLHVDQDMAKPVVKKYVQNDFGETGFRVEGSPGLFIHTGPESEDKLSKAESEEELTCSHGCLHVQPAKRNELMTEGYLQKGVTIVIKGYKDVLDPGSPNYGKSNAALAAAFMAAGDRASLIGQEHLMRAARTEYRSMGHILSDRR